MNQQDHNKSSKNESQQDIDRAKKSMIIFIVVIIFMIILAVLALFLLPEKEENQNTTVTTPQQSEVTNDLSNETSQPSKSIPLIEEIELVSVGVYEGSGTATRTVEGEYVHTVTAKIGEPVEGDFYEGWLVGPSIISTGKLTEEFPGEWSLTYTSDKDLFEYTSVVITEETEANGLDNKPEDHVLEGSF